MTTTAPCSIWTVRSTSVLSPWSVRPSIADLRQLGVRVGFVTNNAGRSPEVVVAHLNGLGIECHQEDVVTSAQAIAQLMARELPSGAQGACVRRPGVGRRGDGVASRPSATSPKRPMRWCRGYDPQMTFPRLEDAAFAIQRGARWYASNTDINRPTNLGISPGAGAQIAAVRRVRGRRTDRGWQGPTRRCCRRPSRGCGPFVQFVGDRLDTDIEGANNVDIDSFLVFTGARGKRTRASAIPQQRPTAIGHRPSRPPPAVA